jgi:hypothetical protein
MKGGKMAFSPQAKEAEDDGLEQTANRMWPALMTRLCSTRPFPISKFSA